MIIVYRLRNIHLYLGVLIHNLSDILSVEGTGEIDVEYKRYVAVQWNISEVRAYKKAVLMLVINASKFEDRVTVQVRLIMDEIWGKCQ